MLTKQKRRELEEAAFMLALWEWQGRRTPYDEPYVPPTSGCCYPVIEALFRGREKRAYYILEKWCRGKDSIWSYGVSPQCGWFEMAGGVKARELEAAAGPFARWRADLGEEAWKELGFGDWEAVRPQESSPTSSNPPR